MAHPPLFHAYHVFADGDWAAPVTEHCDALTRFGLYDELETLMVGFVGTPENITAVRKTLDVLVPKYEVCAEVPHGWEQETLTPLWEFTKTRDGLVSYAHTKGASRPDRIQRPWRRSMTYYNFVQWECPVEALQTGYLVAGCHWFYGGLEINPVSGTGGMFGGTYWWTHCELLRKNQAPGRASRFEAEHWIGQITEHTPLTPDLICDMNPGKIAVRNLQEHW